MSDLEFATVIGGLMRLALVVYFFICADDVNSKMDVIMLYLFIMPKVEVR